MTILSRRDFLGAALLTLSAPLISGKEKDRELETVYLIKNKNRREGLRKAIGFFGNGPFNGDEIVIKTNLNSSDPYPASTDSATLETIIEIAKEKGVKNIVVAERSGMGETRKVMEKKGIFEMGKSLGFKAVVLDELPQEDWVAKDLRDSHWKRGVLFPKLFLDADRIIQTCCLKTHRFGGEFTISLKNSVGMVSRFSPFDNYDYMKELHESSFQKEMISEINLLYKPSLIILDAMKVFTDMGPEKGPMKEANLILSGKNRVAIDAVGVAILRYLGSNPAIMRGRIFEKAQIKRAVELGLGPKGPEYIEIKTDDDESERIGKL
ncbi:MAG: DUF362 domain-containing protein, partial [bacterium]|nr:DUF362 domain-containing protein [bacterium]